MMLDLKILPLEGGGSSPVQAKKRGKRPVYKIRRGLEGYVEATQQFGQGS